MSSVFCPLGRNAKRKCQGWGGGDLGECLSPSLLSCVFGAGIGIICVIAATLPPRTCKRKANIREQRSP